MLRFKADRRTVAALTLHTTTTLAIWAWNPSGIWLALAIAWLATISWICAVIAHNVVHTPVFQSRTLSRAFQVWVSCSYGFPISDYVPGHNLSHHRYTQLAEDVMRTTRVNFRWNLLNLLFFLPIVTPGILRGNGLYRKQVGKAAKLWRQQLLIESVCVWGIKLAVLAIDWKRGLLLVFLPHVLANWGIVSVNYLQHDGCDETHPVNHSRNFVGRLFNYFTFNNGFHGAHHLTPGLHWSLLPAYHATHFSPTIHPALEQPSLFLYLFKTFIWPGKRLTFDGKPVEVKAMADRDWVRGDEPASPDNFVAA